jgi:tetratricopeptide (TPR) repeat protein
VIGCYRDTEIGEGHPLRALRAQVGLDTEVVELAGLDQREVGRLIAEVGGIDVGSDLLAEVFGRTAGNPFFVREVTRLLASTRALGDVSGRWAGVPDGVRQVVEQRLAHLPQACKSMLAVAAVVGQQVSAEVLARASSCTPAMVLELAGQAVRARVLVEPSTVSGRYRFAHDLFRETIYDRLPVAVRAGVHRRVGEALEQLRTTGAEVGAAELAHHFMHAAIGSDSTSVTNATTTVGYCISAAEEAIARLSYEDAVGHYQWALDGLAMAGVLSSEDRLELLLGLGNARRATGDAGGARGAYRLAADLARTIRDAAGLARAALGTVVLSRESGTSHDAAIALLEEALAALHTEDGDLRARVMAGLARVLYHSFGEDDTRAAELSRAALDLARRGGIDSTLVVCLLARHDAIWYPGTALERRALAAEMAEVARRVTDRELAAEASLLGATAALELGEDRFVGELEEFIGLALALRQPRWTYLAMTRQVSLATLSGRLNEAGELLAKAEALGEEIDEPDRANVAFIQLWELRTAQGRRADLTAVLRNFDRPPVREMATPRLALALLAGHDSDGAEALLPTLDRPPTFVRDLLLLSRWSDLGEAAAALGLSALCGRCYDAMAPYAGDAVVTAGAVGFGGAVEHHLGVLAAAMGRTDAAAGHFERAVAMHAGLGARPWLARTQCEWAAVLQARGRPVDQDRTVELLRAARAAAAAIGMTQIQQRIDELSATPVNGFRRDGDVWTVSYGGTDVRFKHAKGLADIAVLLGAPGREVAAVTLVETAPATPRVWFGSDPVLDATARERYRARLAELDAILDESDRRADRTRGAAAQAERDVLIRELTAAVGLGGRARGLGDDAERARKAATARIRDSIARITAAHPALGAHLSESITTGLFCRYNPPHATSWRL